MANIWQTSQSFQHTVCYKLVFAPPSLNHQTSLGSDLSSGQGFFARSLSCKMGFRRTFCHYILPFPTCSMFVLYVWARLSSYNVQMLIWQPNNDFDYTWYISIVIFLEKGFSYPKGDLPFLHRHSSRKRYSSTKSYLYWMFCLDKQINKQKYKNQPVIQMGWLKVIIRISGDVTRK